MAGNIHADAASRRIFDEHPVFLFEQIESADEVIPTWIFMILRCESDHLPTGISGK